MEKKVISEKNHSLIQNQRESLRFSTTAKVFV